MSEKFLEYKKGESQRIQTFIYGILASDLFVINAINPKDAPYLSIWFFVSLMLGIFAYFCWYRMEMMIAGIIEIQDCEADEASKSRARTFIDSWQMPLHMLSFASIIISTILALIGGYWAKFDPACCKLLWLYPNLVHYLFWGFLVSIFAAILIIHILCFRASHKAYSSFGTAI